MVRGILFDFHETLISADRWMAMETGGIAPELLRWLGIWQGEPSPEDRKRVERAYARLRTISLETGLEYPAQEVARAVLRAIDGDERVTDDGIAAAVAGLFRSYLPDVTVKEHVAETLHVLASLGYRMGLVSNAAYGPFLTWSLEKAGLDRYFEQIVVSANVGIRKPRREIFTAALQAMQLAVGETVYVGNDYIKDVMGAKLAGLGAIWIPGPAAGDYRDVTPVHPDAIIERFDALPQIVGAWGRAPSGAGAGSASQARDRAEAGE